MEAAPTDIKSLAVFPAGSSSRFSSCLFVGMTTTRVNGATPLRKRDFGRALEPCGMLDETEVNRRARKKRRRKGRKGRKEAFW